MQLSGTTTLLGLIGSPVAHSKSPAMYNYCFRKFHMDCAYLAFDVAADQVEQSVKAIRTLHMRGANVTMPFKTTVVPYMDRLTPAAETIQAVNTIVNEDGVLVGHNTDGCGYTQNLRRNGIEVAGKKITLIGLWRRRFLHRRTGCAGRRGGAGHLQSEGQVLAQHRRADGSHPQGRAQLCPLPPRPGRPGRPACGSRPL